MDTQMTTIISHILSTIQKGSIILLLACHEMTATIPESFLIADVSGPHC
jgi:hypothetical protein